MYRVDLYAVTCVYLHIAIAYRITISISTMRLISQTAISAPIPLRSLFIFWILDTNNRTSGTNDKVIEHGSVVLNTQSNKTSCPSIYKWWRTGSEEGTHRYCTEVQKHAGDM